MQHIEIGGSFLHALPWFAWIALAAILSGAVSGILKMIITHRERMAMIRVGIDPDSPNRKAVYEELDA